MKSDSKDRILKMAGTERGVRPHDIVTALGMSAAGVHKHIRELVAKGLLVRSGKPPHVIYKTKKPDKRGSTITFSGEIEKVLDKYFCYFSPSGIEYRGREGFLIFLNSTNQAQDPLARAEEYSEIIQTAEKFRDSAGLIDGIPKLQATFKECHLERVYYSDFYSLPKYGKTKLGQYLLHGKSGQNRRLIQSIAKETKQDLDTIIKRHKIDALAYAPHSIPRKIPFLKEYKRLLDLHLPEISLLKAYSGDVPIAQKSLSKLSERIENARQTIYVKEREFTYKRILVIDDALGSGATMNEIAAKLSYAGRLIYGYAVVDSYKGFEVIREI